MRHGALARAAARAAGAARGAGHRRAQVPAAQPRARPLRHRLAARCVAAARRRRLGGGSGRRGGNAGAFLRAERPDYLVAFPAAWSSRLAGAARAACTGSRCATTSPWRATSSCSTLRPGRDIRWRPAPVAAPIARRRPDDRTRLRPRAAPTGASRPQLEARWRGDPRARPRFVLGPAVREFEARLGELPGRRRLRRRRQRHRRAGGGAARPRACGPATRCIVPAFTFFATAEAVVLAGGAPVFADVEPRDPQPRSRRRGGARHLAHRRHHRRPPLRPAVRRRRARGAARAARPVAARGRGAGAGRGAGTAAASAPSAPLAAWSFYPSKNLGCFGDGGAVTGRDAALLERVRLLANHGQTGRYQHAEVGTNSRLDALQAAVLLCRLELARAGQRPPARARLQATTARSPASATCASSRTRRRRARSTTSSPC